MSFHIRGSERPPFGRGRATRRRQNITEPCNQRFSNANNVQEDRYNERFIQPGNKRFSNANNVQEDRYNEGFIQPKNVTRQSFQNPRADFQSMHFSPTRFQNSSNLPNISKNSSKSKQKKDVLILIQGT